MDTWKQQLYDVRECARLQALLDAQCQVVFRDGAPRARRHNNGKQSFAVEEQGEPRFGIDPITQRRTIAYPLYYYPGALPALVGPWRPVVIEIRDAVDQLTGQRSSFVNVKKYPPKGSMSLHADKAENWRPGTGVAIISFGYTRIFEIREQTGPNSSKLIRSVEMKPGMVLFLGPETNAAYKHCVKPLTSDKQRRAARDRWSLQFREVIVYQDPRAMTDDELDFFGST